MSVPKAFFMNILKGFFIGIGAIIPGLSGGTTAIIVGLFEEIIESTANIFKHFGRSLSLLLPVASGALLGVICFSEIMGNFCKYSPTLSKLSFCAISFISTTIFIRKSLSGKFTKTKTVSLLSGILIALFVTVFMQNENTAAGTDNSFYLFMIGIPLALALVLPAISFSYMLLFFGLYEPTLEAITNFDMLFLLPLLMGIAFGGLIFSKILLMLMNKYSQETYAFVLGFVFCSFIDILL